MAFSIATVQLVLFGISTLDSSTTWNNLKVCFLAVVTTFSVIVLGLGSHFIDAMNPHFESFWATFAVAIATLTISTLPALYVLRQYL